jgi:hypothetical protein
VIDGEEHFTVAAFVAERGKGASKSYLVHWEGYGPEHRQWLTRRQLLEDLSKDAYDKLLLAFESNKSNTKTRRRR